MIPTPDRERSVDYMHSTFIDNVLGGLLGIRAQTNATVVVLPLVDPRRMTHFAVDNLRLHGREVAISWDPSGRKYSCAQDPDREERRAHGSRRTAVRLCRR